jgi:hypothetical protein
VFEYFNAEKHIAIRMDEELLEATINPITKKTILVPVS